MKIDYYLLNPTGNITILVKTPVSLSDRRFVADKLMEAEPSCEQVGFIVPSDKADIAVEMTGGEFCGNATLCAAFVSGKDPCIVKMSGADSPIIVKGGTAEMPHPLSCELEPVPVVRFSGITHTIVSEKMNRAEAESFVKSLCQKEHADAAGVMFTDGDTVTPLVYVPESDTMFWEHSCASGACAVAAFRSKSEKRAVSLDIKMPGGVLKVSADPDGNISLSGKVSLIKEGTINV